MSKKYIVSFKKTAQIGPDDYERRNETMIIDRETTVGDIVDWYFVQLPGSKRFFKVEITEPTRQEF